MPYWFLTAVLTAALPDLPLIVLDAGHGGAQQGAGSVCGVIEKDISLILALELGRVLAASNRVKVLQTRESDETVSLEQRAQKANDAGASVFMSIHANAASTPESHGFEVYFLSQHAADKRIAQLAFLENDGRTELAEVGDSLQLILGGLRMQAVHDESQQLAIQVDRAFAAKFRAHGRGVLQAPFFVLRQSEMAAVLVEVGYLTNAQECRRLADPANQKSLVQSLATAVLSHVLRTKPAKQEAATSSAAQPPASTGKEISREASRQSVN